ncbi:hypothetical protein Bp8pS_102 [Bacillus phage vB_BpuM-BpSp]|nr:hypothetical protein Bp8pS_102 [Bacillus phage vB_BpuM-BpSp]
MGEQNYEELFRYLLDYEKSRFYDTKALFRFISSKEIFYKNEKFMEEYKDKIHWSTLLEYYKDIPIDFIEKYKNYIFSANYDLSKNMPLYYAFKNGSIPDHYFERHHINALSDYEIRDIFINFEIQELRSNFINKSIDLIIERLNFEVIKKMIWVNSKIFNTSSLNKLIKKFPDLLDDILTHVNELSIEFLDSIYKDRLTWMLIGENQKMNESYILENVENGNLDFRFTLNNHFIDKTERILEMEEKFILENYFSDNKEITIVLDSGIKRSKKINTYIKMKEL